MSHNFAFLSLTTAPQSMALNEKIPFNITNMLKGMTYNSTNRYVTVKTKGLYQISFGYHHTRSQQFIITVNGTSLGNQFKTLGNTIVSLLYLNANDNVAMMKCDATDTTNNMTAFLTLQRVY